MKKIVRAIIVMVMLIMCFTLSSCEIEYASGYSASGMVTKNTSNESFFSFDSFSGKYKIQLNSKGDEKAFIIYNATLKEGNIKVYYDFNNEKLSLFEIGADGSVEGRTEGFTSNKTIYIIIESDGKCNGGSFSFTLEKSK